MKDQPFMGRAVRRLGSVGVLLVLAAGSVPAQPSARNTPSSGDGVPLKVPSAGRVGFVRLNPRDLGILWTNYLSPELINRRYYSLSGAGVAAGDFDQDGHCDFFLAGKESPNALYRNRGDWSFEDVTAQAGVADADLVSTGATFADLDGDSWPDLIVTTFTGPDRFFLNNRDGTFRDFTEESGISQRGGANSIAVSDLDGDGDLDLYLNQFGNVAIFSDGVRLSTRKVRGEIRISGRYADRVTISDGKLMELGEPDSLYWNDGQGHFQPVQWKNVFRDSEGNSVENQPDFGLAAQIRDINLDGLPDIYVCNDFSSPDRCWINDGQGHFQAAPEFSLRNMSYASMGVDFADADRDGALDFLTVEMLSRDHARALRQTPSMGIDVGEENKISDQVNFPRNVFQWNRGDGTYAEIANYAGLAATDWSWCPVFIDVDLDGFEDVLVTNGTIPEFTDRDTRERKMLSAPPVFDTPNAAFRNRHDLTFADASEAWGFNAREISQGVALADLDNDGDQDVIVNCLNGPPLIYRNESSAPRIAVRLRGDPGNALGIGAQITVRGGPVDQYQEIVGGGRYLSGDDPMRVFAAGDAKELSIEVRWRDGKRSVVRKARPNHLYVISKESAVVPAPEAKPTPIQSLFKNVSQKLNHRHHDDLIDEDSIQLLLPKKMGHLGPGVAWYDLDGDGREELILGAGRGGAICVFRVESDGSFEQWQNPAWAESLESDVAGLVGWSPKNGGRALLAAKANFGAPSSGNATVHQFFISGSEIRRTDMGAPGTASLGPLSLADIDLDGDLDLFAGGRVTPGKYPEATDSFIFINDDGKLVFDSKWSAPLKSLGLVSGSVFSDLDGDGDPDLIVACEWGPVRILKNEGDHFTDVTDDYGLSAFTGWWNSVTTGDLDNDGRMDIVAGNWGLNHAYSTSPEHPARLYYADYLGNGRYTLIEAKDDLKSGEIVPLRSLDELSRAFPVLASRFPTHASFSRASVPEVLGDVMGQTREVQITTTASIVFLNRDDHFEPMTLPKEAQFAPVFGLNVVDFDGDGNEDIFCAQNFFGTYGGVPRLDAGRGLLLSGNGKGGFKSVDAQFSGIKIYGEQRGSAVADFNRDGRVDLAVSQNNDETELFENVKTQPGLRVLLRGPMANPDGIGARMRLEFENGFGPMREVHAGGGYWSQDSPVQVLATPTSPLRLHVFRPGGKEKVTEIPAGAREITVALNLGDTAENN